MTILPAIDLKDGKSSKGSQRGLNEIVQRYIG